MKQIPKRLGIAIYPEKFSLSETKSYLKLAYKHGFRRVFGNLLNIKNDKTGQKIIARNEVIYQYAQQLGFEVMLDVNPDFFKTWNIEPTDMSMFRKMGASAIRFDLDYGGKIEAQVASGQNNEHFKVELNASTNLDTVIQTLKLGGLPKNVITCHNFYPMRHTGLSLEKFVAQSTKIHAMGLRVAAFIGLDDHYEGVGPWPINDGLCTVEDHRNLSTIEQLVAMLGYDFISDICLGEQIPLTHARSLFAKITVILQTYQYFINNNVLEVRVKKQTGNQLAQNIIFKNQGHLHTNRSDFNAAFFRSTMPRVYYQDQSIRSIHAGQKLVAGDMIIINNKKGRYKGELHVLFKSIDDHDEQIRNFVATVWAEDLVLLQWVKDHDKKIKFIAK